MKQKYSVVIRTATRKDIPSILAIEEKAAPHPVSRRKIESEFSQEKAHLFVALSGEKIIGYLDCWLISPEAEVINVAVDPKFQRQGVATQLFQYFFSSHPDINQCHLEVRVSNSSAQAFYKKLGFEMSGQRKKYYADGEDAVLMFLSKIG